MDWKSAAESKWGQNVPATDWDRMFQLRADGDARCGAGGGAMIPFELCYDMRRHAAFSKGAFSMAAVQTTLELTAK